MIENEQQYHITKAHADRFEQALARLAEHPPDDKEVHPLLLKAHIEAVQSQLDDLRAQIAKYEAQHAMSTSSVNPSRSKRRRTPSSKGVLPPG